MTVIAGAIGAALLALAGYALYLKRKVDGMFVERVREGRLHPEDVAVIRSAARAGLPAYRWPDGRIRLVAPPDSDADPDGGE